MSKQYFLGIDTSCYTTSCAIVDEAGNLIDEARKVLDVKKGSRGLAQSNMVFQHTRALPNLLKNLPDLPIKAIGISAFPRREEDSYMPAFLVGKGYGESLGHFLKCPVFSFSHQENHILAALRETKEIPSHDFLSLHLSGGTTEFLLCKRQNDEFFNTKILGATNDLHCGQFVDRIGVQLGLPFPAGPHLEALALKGRVQNPIKISANSGNLSFSGPASECARRIERGAAPETIAAEVFDVIGRGLEKFLTYYYREYKIPELIAVGGVMSNSIIRKKIIDFSQPYDIKITFASPKFSSDNATGNAFGASVLYLKKSMD